MSRWIWDGSDWVAQIQDRDLITPPVEHDVRLGLLQGGTAAQRMPLVSSLESTLNRQIPWQSVHTYSADWDAWRASWAALVNPWNSGSITRAGNGKLPFRLVVNFCPYPLFKTDAQGAPLLEASSYTSLEMAVMLQQAASGEADIHWQHAAQVWAASPFNGPRSVLKPFPRMNSRTFAWRARINYEHFKTAWDRMVGIFRANGVTSPIVYSPLASVDANSHPELSEPTLVDWYGMDVFDDVFGSTDDLRWNYLTTQPHCLPWLVGRKTMGKPLCFGEFGLSPESGDTPSFINRMAFFAGAHGMTFSVLSDAVDPLNGADRRLVLFPNSAAARNTAWSL